MKFSNQHQLLYYLILISAIGNHCVQGKARFIQVPPNPLYTPSGGTARFIWDYTVDNRTEEFQLFSPTWKYYANGAAVIIGYENSLRDWEWIITYRTCPSRLLYPTIRVNKESTATLVISNVTTNDSGFYEMVLLLKTTRKITSKIQLLVTTQPKFTNQLKANNLVLEGRDVRISCSASGTPTPNITWVLLKDKAKEIKSQGVGYADLIIQNITRHQNGTYQCQATNNPHEHPVEMKTQVTIWYKPHITFLNWTGDETIIVLCVASGQPHPLIKWYYPSGMQVVSEVTDITGGSRMVLEIPDSNVGLYGVYKCNATNAVGWQVGYINITQIKRPTTITVLEKDFTITSKRDVKTKGSITPTLASLQTTPNHECSLPSSNTFYQGKTFALINLSITCVLFIINVVLIAYIYFVKCATNSFKVADKTEESTRFSRPVVARTANEDACPVALTAVKTSTADDVLTENTSKISPNEDYERISEKSESSFDTGNAAQGTSECDVQLSQTHHDYQELLNTDALLSSIQSYQALNRTLGDSVRRREEPPLHLRKYEELNFVNNPQSSDYQKLHLFTNIGDKK